MAQLHQDYEKFTAQDTEIMVVGPDNAAAFLNYWRKNDLPFIGLPDPTHSVLKLYGQEVNLFKLGRILAQVAIDKNGTARYVHYGYNAANIPANEEILGLLKTMNEEIYASN